MNNGIMNNKIGRNDPCSCESGRKYKKCCINQTKNLNLLKSVLNIPLKAQQKIVDEIKVELDKQEAIKNQIKRERNKTDKIIEKAIQ